MRLKGAVIAFVASIFVVTACTAATEGEPVAAEGNAADLAAGSALESEPTAVPEPVKTRTVSNVPMTRLAPPGETPPQFVLFSFDGVGLTPNWDMFLETAERSMLASRR